MTRDTQHPDGTVNYKKNYAATARRLHGADRHEHTVDNIRILDPNLISPTSRNAQKIGRPYAFSRKLDVDRYAVKGTTKDYVVGVRELATGSNLTGSQNNWINQHTVYTHGYGFVAAEADKDVTNGNTTDYTEGNIPPTGLLDDHAAGCLLRPVDERLLGGRGKGTPRESDAQRQRTT